MKKSRLISIILTFAVLIGCFSMPAYAADDSRIVSTSVEYYDDGSYDVITVTENVSKTRANTKSGNKTCTHSNSSGVVVWKYTLNASFSYTGSSASCTNVNDTYLIYDDAWHLSSHSSSKSGNKASGTITMNKKTLIFTTDEVTKNLTLTCSPTGVLS